MTSNATDQEGGRHQKILLLHLQKKEKAKICILKKIAWIPRKYEINFYQHVSSYHTYNISTTTILVSSCTFHKKNSCPFAQLTRLTKIQLRTHLTRSQSHYMHSQFIKYKWKCRYIHNSRTEQVVFFY